MNGGIALGADGLDGLVLHSNDFTGVDDFNGQSRGGGMIDELGPQVFFVPDKKDVNAVVPGRLNRTFDFRFRRPVGAHRVQRYDAWHGEFRLAGFFDFQNFAALVVTTFGAGTMWHLAFVTVGALGKGVAF